MKRQVTLKIASTEYKFITDADEAHLNRLVALLEERIHSAEMKTSRPVSPSQLLAVAALGLADDLLNLDEKQHRLENEVRDVVQSAIDRIDEELERSPT